ncbi:Glyoxylate/hydroxypyruvate reductase (D-isomer-specific 2-hydroxy acid dehydrogenase superfamily) [Phaffia rhodozyma]|uniref:Glyoxylate/hydroxypyruvate reductase (D-isomer-specific 2-hydroxy acid dehydrogenase superfamily) n=1 Tax=Phaffia rhodozyma TaxID=264483 RepID=A0A0F7SGK6_PHARH|nr:Glyoxylate/hydroxypyruvate reductase (D-isomer-specific 2-hydroxy acid dehydrogenase superfamily) [Phaffia rhodozyma]
MINIFSVGRPESEKAQKELNELQKSGKVEVWYIPDEVIGRSAILDWVKSSAIQNGGFHCVLFWINRVYQLLPTDETLWIPFLPPFVPEGTLKLICGPGAGFDKVPVKFLSEHKVWYSNTPEAVAEPTALHAVILTLTTLRKTTAAERSVRRGEWEVGGTSIANKAMGRSQLGLRVGILGMGSIGRHVARYLTSMGMTICYHNRRQLPDSQAAGATYIASKEEFFENIDVLSIHVPLNPSTEGMVGEKEISSMPRGSYIINTARGQVIDTSALVEALKSGHIAGAGLDVFDNECSSEIDPYLMNSDDVTLTPHFACNVNGMLEVVEIEQINNARVWINEGTPLNTVNSW